MTLTATWRAKKQLTPAEYTSLTVAVFKILKEKVTVANTDFDITWSKTFVSSFLQDDACHILQSLNSPATQEPNLSTHEGLIRHYTLKLAWRLAKIPNGLDIANLVDLAIVYGSRQAVSVRNIFTDACGSTPPLLHDFRSQVIPALNASLKKIQSVPFAVTRKTAYILSQLLLCGPPLVLPFVSNPEFVQTLAKCYQVDMQTSTKGPQGGQTAEEQKDILYIKTSLVDSLHAIVQTLLNNGNYDALFDMLFVLLELPSSQPDNKSRTPFISQCLLADYQYAFGLSNLLTEKLASLDDARVDLLSATLAEMSPSFAGRKEAKGLAPLLGDRRVQRRKGVTPVQESASIKSKGKGKAVGRTDEQDGNLLDLAVSQVLEIFPNYTLQHIRRCLKDHRFNGNAEMLISALLEGTLPRDLERTDEALSDTVQPVDEFKYTKDRRNVFNNVPMDSSRLKLGKTNTIDNPLDDRSFIEQMKADIIRRAVEIAKDDTEEEYEVSADTTKQPRIIFEDDFDEMSNEGIAIVGDGEHSDRGDSDHDSTGNPPSPETILALAYIEDPKYFERDANTRRSKARADLKAKTGWGDEQIEGWKIMLERNPKKDKVLQKYEFAGNKPLDRNVMPEPGPSGSKQGGDGVVRGRGRGRGGHGGGGTGDTRHDRAWKDKNKARNANHNRKRGHDKKMARGGAPAP